MVKAENAKLLIDGKEVTNDYEFTADKENMEVQIEFTFNGSTLGGKQLVTFEELYDMTNPEEPKKVTEHKLSLIHIYISCDLFEFCCCESRQSGGCKNPDQAGDYKAVLGKQESHERRYFW